MKPQHALRSLTLCMAAALSLLAATVPAAAGSADAGVSAARREVFGFFDAGDADYMLHEANFSVLSTVAFFSVQAMADGTLRESDGATPTRAWVAWTSGWMDQVIERAHAAGCKVVLSIDRFAWHAADRTQTVELLSSVAARRRLANAIADALVERGVDGVNLDFEPIPKAVRYEYVDFVREVRAALDSRRAGLQLTFDATGYPTTYALPELLADGAADAVYLMAYPFRTAHSKTAGATSPLGGRAYDVAAAVDRYLSRISPDKVILGLPYYGSEWSTLTRYANSRTRQSPATYGKPGHNTLSEAWALADLHGWRWNDREHVAWTRWRYRACPSCPLTWRQAYFDDLRSLGLKYDLANSRDLRGVGLFKIGNDSGHPELYDLLAAKFAP